MDLMNQVLELFVKFATIGGGLWLVWGAVTFGGGLKDHNGPQTQSGLWQIVGGGGTWMFLMPVVAGCLVSTISFFVVNWIEWGRGVAPAPSAYLTDEEVARKIAEESAGR